MLWVRLFWWQYWHLACKNPSKCRRSLDCIGKV